MDKPGFSYRDIGPGLVIAATGIGAGDLIAASVAGARFGIAILWAAIIGAAMKFVMNEGLARWQLATGTTLLEGWVQQLPKFISIYFFTYLLLWTFVVAAALIASTGMAAHALFPQLSLEAWAVLHSLLAVVLVLVGRYQLLELLMKVLLAAMMVNVIVCAAMVIPDIGNLHGGVLPGMPDGSILFIFSVIGGVGGSVTMLCYGYWIRERGWNARDDLLRTRRDLAVSYLLTGLFGMAVMIISAGLLPETVTGPDLVLALAGRFEEVIGTPAKWLFLAGFWSAVFSSMLGVWQGIPYLYADFVRQYTYRDEHPSGINVRSFAYRGYLLYIAVPPMIMLLVDKPVWLVLVYAVAGAFFMPLLALLLLFMNNSRQWMGDLRNGLTCNVVLLVSIAMFGLLLYDTISKQF